MYNLQSGLHRQSFPSRTIPLTSYPPSSARHSTLPIARKTHKHGPAIFEEKHNREISGLAIDSLNRMVVSSGLDGRVKVRSTFLRMVRRSQADLYSSGSFSQDN